MTIKQLIKEMIERDASDLFYMAGGVPRLKVDGKITTVGETALSVSDVFRAIEELTTPQQRELFKNNLDIDFALYLEELERRFRISIFMQRNNHSMVIRNVRSAISNFEELNLPGDVLRKLCMEARGLVLLTGSAGSCKSTTIASMI